MKELLRELASVFVAVAIVLMIAIACAAMFMIPAWIIVGIARLIWQAGAGS